MDLDGQVSSPGELAECNGSGDCSTVAKPIVVQSATLDGDQSSSSSSSNSQSSNSRAEQTSFNNAPGILVDRSAILR